MANIKISELNELLEGDRAYDDYLPIVDSSANETKKVSVKNLIPNNVELIAVTDTAPTSFGTGDKYYNTTTNRIYTARSGEWISPEEPIKGILYVILEDQKTFTYDEYNETLVSVGGGGGGGIAVYPDEPEEDTKLYIEESDLDFQGLEIANEYNTADNMTYSCDYINGTVLYENASGSNGNITLSNSLSNYRFVDIVFTRTNKDIIKVLRFDTSSTVLTLDTQNLASNREVYFSVAKYEPSGASLNLSTFKDYYQSANGQSWNSNTGSSSSIYIMKVIGYK